MDGIHPPLSVDLDRAEILILSPPSSYPPCSSFKPSFWAVTVPSTSNRRHFAPLSSRLFTRFVHSTWPTRRFIFFLHFQLYIYLETRWIKAYVSCTILRESISRMLVEKVDCSTSRSLSCSNGRKSESPFLSGRCLFSRCLISLNFRFGDLGVKYSRLTLGGVVSLPREQSYFNVTWIGISLIDKWDLPGIRDDNSVFLFFSFTFLFFISREIFPATQKQKKLG